MSTEEVTAGVAAQRALIKMLAKIGLLDAASVGTPFKSDGAWPIQHFAHAGKFVEADAIKKVAAFLHMEVFELDDTNIEQCLLMLDSEIFKKIPINQWKILRVLPLSALTPQRVTVAMANPLDHEAKTRLEFELGCSIEALVGSEREIMQVLNRQLTSGSAFKLDSIIEQGTGSKPAPESMSNAALESTVFTDDPDSPPVVRLVNKILSDSVERGASDIHIEPEKDELHVKVRVDGIIQPLFVAPRQFQTPTVSRIKLLAGMDIAERRKPQDGRFRIKTADGMKDLRVAVAPTIHGENVVIRVLSSDLGKLEFDTLGMPLEVQQRFIRLLNGSSRVVLVTGPTGSGKTSTLYTGLTALVDGTRTVVTIEDPIEYRMQGVNQIQVNPKIGLDFASGLRSVVRQDPDVVMVGEIRDRETASIAMQIAQTGHLVLSTFHTNSAVATITRLRDLGIPPFIVSSCLGSVLSQRLVRKLCKCAEPVDDRFVRSLAVHGVDFSGAKFSAGCKECNNTGYVGRVGIFSLLEINEDVREAIRLEQSERQIEQVARRSGFQSLREAGLDAVARGVTTIEELVRVLGSIEPPGETAETQEAAAGSTIHRRKVLLVEDDENTRAVLTMLLKNELYDVVEAANGLEGLERVFAAPPDVVVCDCMMPKMNGIQFVQRVRADARTREIPILMLTAIGHEDNEVQLLTSGADDFVTKGTDTRVLLARVQRLLSRDAV